MKAIKVQFKTLGKRYYFGTAGLKLEQGTAVVVNTIRGLELGYCFGEIFDLKLEDLTSELKDVVRIATEEDIKKYNDNKLKEPEILKKTKEFSKNHNLELKVLEAEYTLDCSKLIIYFESEGRVDFRDLVKDLAEEYHTRIELRQVGSRDGAKVFGGIGPCGRQVCCNLFLKDFEHSTIKMAKNQGLSLNPANISGLCGRLMCCLSYENDGYVELLKQMPKVNAFVETPDGKGQVVYNNLLKKKVQVKFVKGDTTELKEYEVGQIKFEKNDK